MPEAAKDKRTQAREFLASVLATIPADQQESAKILFAQDSFLDAVGDGVLSRSEASRKMDEAQKLWDKATAWSGNLTDWHQKINAELERGKTAITELDRMRQAAQGGGGTGDDGGAPPKLPDNVVTKEVFEQTLSNLRATAGNEVAALASVLSRLTVQHFRDFNEVLDTDELIKYCRTNQVSIDRGGYEGFTEAKRKEKEEKARQEEIAAAEKRGEDRARQQHGGAVPYVVDNTGGGGAAAGTLRGLTHSKDDKAAQQYGVAAAVKAFHEGRRAQG